VGTMEPRKNLRRLLGAYKAYIERCSTAKKLKVVGGGGWGKIDPHELVAGLGLGHMVEIEGKVSDQALSAFYAGAYGLVMPSIYEGFGLPVVECLAYGVPAIVSQDSALSEVAGVAGYTVDPLSEESICDALCVLTQQQPLYDRLRLSAAQRALDFSWEASAQVTHALLCDCG
jgi:glycosyltransferase involved in cell wall biosynthesis